MSEKSKRKAKNRLPVWLFVVITLGFLILCTGFMFTTGLYEYFLPRVTREISDNEARNFLFNEFGLELPRNSDEVHVVWSQQGSNRISLYAKASFVASPENTELWLENLYICTLSDSFEEERFSIRSFQWNDAPYWWQPEEASNVILGGCTASSRHPYTHFILVDTDDDEIWTTYIVIGFL